ncbi:DUF2330 domain-containing protein [Streptomyces sp. HUAS ZL42]|uniref:DUF2330 domain-containing protein n=1 Tax=Streptomyces sp. HUAS ZL42 TaxID=3231715 RepID=UPI00345E5E65
MVGLLRGSASIRAGGGIGRRVTVVVLALLALQVGSLVAPAHACGCGALIPGDRQRVNVGREVSLVRWDGRQEQIVMSLQIGGDARQAAWIMPVPNRATVQLGDPGLFDELAAATAPLHRTRYHFWPQDGDWPLTTGDGAVGAPPPGVGAGAPPDVGLVGRQRLGPFDVALLTATDPDALDDWLSSNGFAFPARLEGALEPYVEQRWEYVAVRLAPESADTSLNGTLDPLHLTFAAGSPVYPMRLSRLAQTPQSLGLYVLAAHRMEPASRIGGARPRVTFAGRVDATSGELARLAKDTPFLTAVGQEFPTPSTISGDHELRRAATDASFRQVIYEDRMREVAGIPAWLLTIVGGLAAAATVSVWLALRPRPRLRGQGHGHGQGQGQDLGTEPPMPPTPTPGRMPSPPTQPPMPPMPPLPPMPATPATRPPLPPTRSPHPPGPIG